MRVLLYIPDYDIKLTGDVSGKYKHEKRNYIIRTTIEGNITFKKVNDYLFIKSLLDDGISEIDALFNYEQGNRNLSQLNGKLILKGSLDEGNQRIKCSFTYNDKQYEVDEKADDLVDLKDGRDIFNNTIRMTDGTVDGADYFDDKIYIKRSALLPDVFNRLFFLLNIDDITAPSSDNFYNTNIIDTRKNTLHLIPISDYILTDDLTVKSGKSTKFKTSFNRLMEYLNSHLKLVGVIRDGIFTLEDEHLFYGVETPKLLNRYKNDILEFKYDSTKQVRKEVYKYLDFDQTDNKNLCNIDYKNRTFGETTEHISNNYFPAQLAEIQINKAQWDEFSIENGVFTVTDRIPDIGDSINHFLQPNLYERELSFFRLTDNTTWENPETNEEITISNTSANLVFVSDFLDKSVSITNLITFPPEYQYCQFRGSPSMLTAATKYYFSFGVEQNTGVPLLIEDTYIEILDSIGNVLAWVKVDKDEFNNSIIGGNFTPPATGFYSVRVTMPIAAGTVKLNRCFFNDGSNINPQFGDLKTYSFLNDRLTVLMDQGLEEIQLKSEPYAGSVFAVNGVFKREFNVLSNQPGIVNPPVKASLYDGNTLIKEFSFNHQTINQSLRANGFYNFTTGLTSDGSGSVPLTVVFEFRIGTGEIVTIDGLNTNSETNYLSRNSQRAQLSQKTILLNKYNNNELKAYDKDFDIVSRAESISFENYNPVIASYTATINVNVEDDIANFGADRFNLLNKYLTDTGYVEIDSIEYNFENETLSANIRK